MIVDEFIEIKVPHKTVAYYNQLGYICKVNDIIKVKPSDLPKSSEIRINVKCSNCDSIRNVSNNNYINKQIPKYGYYVCKNCSKVKKKITYKNRYGVDFYSQTEEFKTKCRITNQINWGVDNFRKSPEYEVRSFKTCQEKWGVNYYLQNKENYNKHVEVIKDKYGVDNISKYFSVNIEKRKKTNIEKYGVSHAMQNEEIYNNYINKNFIKYFIDGIFYQSSYELDFINFCKSLNLKIERGPSIKYNDNIYFSDFYLPDYNLICEIKSNYFYQKSIDKNLAKRDASVLNGYNFIFVIDKDYKEFNYILKNNIK